MRRLAVAVVAAAVAGAAPGAAAGAPPHLQDGHPCPDGVGFTCSTLVVPLDRANPRRGSLRLAVAAAENADAPRGVLLVVTGGPGQPGVYAAPRFAGLLGEVRDGYRIVAYDQRGTGATALRCPRLQAEMGTSDLYPPAAAAVRACGAAIGSRRSLYGTDDVVADMEDLRVALGADRLTLDGISYGTYVAERYALAHPKRVARLVLDSVVPHAGGPWMPVEAFPEVARVLRAACAEAACGSDPAADLAAVVRATRNGPRLLDAITLLSIVDPTFREPVDLFALLREARAGRTAALDQWLAVVRRWEAAPSEQLSQGLHASALCGDWRYPWGSSATPVAARKRALDRSAARLSARRLWPFDRATASGSGFVRQCLDWPPTPPTPAARGKLPNVPTLLLAGTHDLSTPIVWARAELRLAPGGRLVTVSGAGHSVQSRARSDAGRDAVRRFLLD